MTEESSVEDVDIATPLTAVLGDPSPGTIYSEPIEQGNDLYITASAWERAGGFGFGSGYGTEEEGGGQGGGAGGGGGGASQGRPVAVIRISETGVQVEPVIDFTKIGVTLLLSLAAFFSMRRRIGG